LDEEAVRVQVSAAAEQNLAKPSATGDCSRRRLFGTLGPARRAPVGAARTSCSPLGSRWWRQYALVRCALCRGI